jgi:hypothetical protein
MSESGPPAGGVSDESAQREEEIRSLSQKASDVVVQAAGVFEEELSAGIEEARRLQRQFTSRGRLEPGDLDEVAARVRSNAHLLIDLVAQRFGDLRSDDVQNLSSRVAKDAHEVFDAIMDLVDAAPAVVNKVMELAETQRATRPEGDTSEGGAAEGGAAEGGAATGTAERKPSQDKPRKPAG